MTAGDDDVELARRVVAAMADEDLQTAQGLLDPAVEWESIGGLEPGTARGTDTVVRSFLDYRRTWARFDVEGEAIVVAGRRLLVLLRETGRGAGSGAEASLASAVILTVSDGRIVHIASYVDHARALAELGASGADPAALERGAVYDLRDGVPLRLPAHG